MNRHQSTARLLPIAALCGWLAILVALNLTDDPLVSAGAFAGLAVLAVRGRHWLLLASSLAVGLGLTVLVPAVDHVLRPLSNLLAGGHAPPVVDNLVLVDAPWLIGVLVACGALRVPAEILGIALVLTVSRSQLLGAIGRLSPRSATVASLGTQLAPLLLGDVLTVRDELRSNGVPLDKPAAFATRARSWLLLWRASLGVVFERAFAAAAALDARGYGTRRPTRGALRHPALASSAAASRLASAGVVVCSVVLLVGVIELRRIMLLPAPSFDLVAAAQAGSTVISLALALVAAGIGLAPALVRPTMPIPRGTGELEALGDIPAAATVRVPATAAVLQLHDVHATYPGQTQPALSIDSLQLSPGELVVVTGDSGAGKSTLLNMISGVMPASTGGTLRGSVLVDGAPANLRGARTTAGVAVVFQDPERQVIVGTVAEEVAFGLRNQGLPIAEVEQRTVRALRDLGVLHLARRACTTLSGGELQRVMLAAAIALRPKVLVLDEPTSQLDDDARRDFWAAVDLLRTSCETAVLTSEHVAAEAIAQCDRLINVASGQLASVMSGDTYRAAPDVEQAFVGLQRPMPGVAPLRLVTRGLHVPSPGARSDPAAGTLIRDLHLAVPAGAVLVLRGPNGVGKTTLLRALRGLAASSGGVWLDGRLIDSPVATAHAIGYVSQQAGPTQVGTTVLEQVRHRAGIANGAPNQFALAALAHAGLDHLADAHPHDLSVGQRQRLAILGATAHAPQLWLLDEPTRGMDTTARRWLAQLVVNHSRQGGVTVLATHDHAFSAAVGTHELELGARPVPPSTSTTRATTPQSRPQVHA